MCAVPLRTVLYVDDELTEVEKHPASLALTLAADRLRALLLQRLLDGVHDRPHLTRSVQVLLAINVAMLFLQWTVVSDTDMFATLGFRDASLPRTLWSAVTYTFAHYGFWHLLFRSAA